MAYQLLMGYLMLKFDYKLLILSMFHCNYFLNNAFLFVYNDNNLFALVFR